jgi:hypothetical protein
LNNGGLAGRSPCDGQKFSACDFGKKGEVAIDNIFIVEENTTSNLRVFTHLMHASLPHLQSAIRVSLEKGQLCRVYQESLNACWPNLADDLRAEKIAQFAAQNRWSVAVRNLGGLGLVAEFQKSGHLVSA